MLRMAQADTPEAARREGILIAQEMLEAVRPLFRACRSALPSAATPPPPRLSPLCCPRPVTE